MNSRPFGGRDWVLSTVAIEYIARSIGAGMPVTPSPAVADAVDVVLALMTRVQEHVETADAADAALALLGDALAEVAPLETLETSRLLAMQQALEQSEDRYDTVKADAALKTDAVEMFAASSEMTAAVHGPSFAACEALQAALRLERVWGRTPEGTIIPSADWACVCPSPLGGAVEYMVDLTVEDLRGELRVPAFEVRVDDILGQWPISVGERTPDVQAPPGAAVDAPQNWRGQRDEAIKRLLVATPSGRAGTWAAFYDAVRDAADGWSDKKTGKEKRGFGDRHLERLVKKSRGANTTK